MMKVFQKSLTWNCDIIILSRVLYYILNEDFIYFIAREGRDTWEKHGKGDTDNKSLKWELL